MSRPAYQAIALYKRHIPFWKTDITAFDYMMLGHFDGLDMLSEQTDFTAMFTHYLKHTRSKARENPGCMSQPIFLLRDRDWTYGHDDEAIRNAALEYPFFFIALLNQREDASEKERQANTDKMIKGDLTLGGDRTADWRRWMDAVDGSLRQAGDRFVYRLYYPLSISQGAVLFLSRDYSSVMNALAGLQRDPADSRPPVQYSYTMSGIRSEYLSDASRSPWSETDHTPLTVTFNLIVRDYSCCESFIRNMNRHFGVGKDNEYLPTAHEMVGNTDIQLRYPGAAPEHIKKAYAELCTPGAASFLHGISSLESYWSCPVRERSRGGPCETGSDECRDGCQSKYNAPPVQPYDAEIIRLLCILDRDIGLSSDAIGFGDMARMINTEGSPYIHYVQAITKPAIRIFKEMLMNNEKIRGYNEDVQIFMNSLYELYSITLRSDKQFFEAPGFNDVLIEVPIKLVVLYTACLYELQSALREPDDSLSQQAFVVTHGGLTDPMTSETLFWQLYSDHRIFHVIMPFYDMYNMRLLLPQLAHEIGHSTPKLARNRSFRSQCITDLIARLVARRIYQRLFHEQAIDSAAHQISDQLNKSISRIEAEVEETVYYTNKLRDLLFKHSENLLIRRDFQDSLFDCLYNREIKARILRDGVFQSSKSIMETTKGRMTIEGNIATLLSQHGKANDPNLEEIIDLVISLFRECYSDIIMINLLDMDACRYLLSFYDAGKDVDDFKNRSFSERVATVIRVMGGPNRIHAGEYLSEDERHYIQKARLWLEQNQNTYLDKQMQQILDDYFGQCIEWLRIKTRFGQSEMGGAKMDLITRRLYHAAVDGEEADILSMIQNLIALVNLSV